MRAALFNFMRDNPGTIIPSNRIARYVRDRLRVTAFWMDPAISEERDLDVLLIVNGAFAFCKVRDDLAPAIRTARRIVWIQNDYTVIPPIPDGKAETPFRLAFRQRRDAGLPDIDYWTTVEPNARATKASSYVNWNALAWEPLSENTIHERRRSSKDYPEGWADQLVYYGSFRHNDGSNRQTRLPYFDRYFKSPPVPTVISSPGAHGKDVPNVKFEERYPLCTHVSKFPASESLVDNLSRYGAGLYLEDAWSGKEFHSPANRFYEMLSAGLPMIFQMESVRMMERAGFDVSEFACLTTEKLAKLFAHREAIGGEQWSRWTSRDYRTELAGQMDAAWKKIKEAT